MSNLATMPAESLRWCPVGFVFTARVMGVPIPVDLKLQGVIGEEVRAWDSINGESIEPLSVRETVYLDSASYEAAVVAAIREMLPECTTICKTKWEMTALMSMNTGYFPAWIPISADPRPWENEYTIDLEEK